MSFLIPAKATALVDTDRLLIFSSGLTLTRTYAQVRATLANTFVEKTILQLTSDVSNNTVTDAVITALDFILPAGKSIDLMTLLPFEAAATTTGIGIGVKLSTSVGANGNVLGTLKTESRISATSSASVVNVVDLGANATVSYDSLSGVSTVGVSNVVTITGILKNYSTNTDASVQIVFRSEVAGSNITIKKGASIAIDTK
jgi:hypothetical protein